MSEWMKEVTYEMLQPKQQDLAEVIGIEATLKLCEVYGGMQNLYIPKNDKVRKKLRNREICRNYAMYGQRVGHIAKNSGLSERTIQEIVKPVRPVQTRMDEIV